MYVEILSLLAGSGTLCSERIVEICKLEGGIMWKFDYVLGFWLLTIP